LGVFYASAPESDNYLHLSVSIDRIPVTNDSVNFDTHSGTATEYVDYQGVHGPLVFPADMTQLTQLLNITIDHDPFSDGYESFSVSLSNPVNAIIGGSPTATLTLVDSQSPVTVQLGASNYTVKEGDDFANVVVNLSHAYDQPVTVSYATADITAVADADYRPVTGSLTFLPGAGLSQTLQVPIIDDTLAEADETFAVSLTSASTLLVGSPATAAITIRDNDSAAPRLIFDCVSVPENIGTTSIRATLSSPFSQDVTVNYQTIDGTALAPGDYQTTSGSLTFKGTQTVPSGETVKYVNRLYPN